MTGIEGRMYQPLAAAVVAAMVAALVLALTLVPVVAGHVLRPPRPGANEDVAVLRKVKKWYAPTLDRCLRHPVVVALVTLAIALPSLLVGLRIGSDFMPQLDEGAFLLQTILPAEAALDEVDRLNHRVEDILREMPEVEEVVRRTGRAERTEDPMPHTVSDVLVVLKPERSRGLEEIEADMRERLEGLPGIAVLFTTPLGMRIDEGLGGTPADLSVRIFGPDLDELSRLAEQVEGLVSRVRGIADLRTEQLTGLPQLQIAVNRQAAARVGLAPGDVIRAVRIGLVGEEQSEIWIGQRRFDLVVRLRDDRRDSFEAIRTLLIDGHDATRIPLGQLAEVTQTFGPAAIRREAGTRRIAVEASVSGRDLGSTAADVRDVLAKELKLPVRAPADCAGVGRRGLLDSRHSPNCVRRRDLRALPDRRDVERVVARGLDWVVRDRRPEQPGVGHTDTRPGGRGSELVGGRPRGEHRARAPQTNDGCHRDPRPVTPAGAAPAWNRNRTPARGRDDWGARNLHALHVAGAPDLLPACAWLVGAAQAAVLRRRVKGRHRAERRSARGLHASWPTWVSPHEL